MDEQINTPAPIPEREADKPASLAEDIQRLQSEVSRLADLAVSIQRDLSRDESDIEDLQHQQDDVILPSASYHLPDEGNNWAFYPVMYPTKDGPNVRVNLGYARIDGTAIDTLATCPTGTVTAATAYFIGYASLPLGNPNVTYVCVRRLIADGTVAEICKVDTTRPLPTDGVYHYKPLCKVVKLGSMWIITERYHRGDWSAENPI